MKVSDLIKTKLKNIHYEFTKDKYIYKIIEYLNILKYWNKKISLTGTDNILYIIDRHIYDSFIPVKLSIIKDRYMVMDLGSGAGFPGIMLSIFYPNSLFYLIDSNNKKIKFLEEIKNKLELKNIIIINERAENLAHNPVYREKYDIIFSRAFANFSVTAEISCGFLRKNGNLIFFSSEKQKIKIAKNLDKLNFDMYNLLGLKIEKFFDYKLSMNNSKFSLIIVKKMLKTSSQIPRSYNKIKKKPYFKYLI